MARPLGYSAGQIRLHWIVVGLIAAQYVLHDPIAAAWEARLRGVEAAFDPLIAAHVAGGLAVLALAVWRLVLRAGRGVPLPPEGEHPALKAAAHVTHWTLYGLMILMPVSGAVAWFGGVERAGEVHEALRLPLLALVVLHVAAALFHQFVLKSGVLDRMRRPSL